MATSSASEEAASAENLLASILASDPATNSFDCFSFPSVRQEPSVVRKKFLSLSLKVHPDKNPHPRAKEAFQKLSQAFETLYEANEQAKHLEEVLERQAQATKDNQQRPKPKRQKTQRHDDWKKKKAEKKKKKNEWVERRWEDVIRELQRREAMEREFVKRKSDERRARRVQGMIWRAMKVCRTLDERAGCPLSFVNGLWAPLYEQEVRQTYRALPEGWELVVVRSRSEKDDPPQRLYRQVATGREFSQHPIPEAETLLAKARAALAINKTSFHTEPRLFLDEIIEYLREDHDYQDMDDDMHELEEEERAVNADNKSTANPAPRCH